MIGIYQITNLVNGKKYIGQSNCIERRFRQHLSLCEQKRFSNKPLYLAFKKYGIQNFIFEVVEECAVDLLNQQEQYWIDYYHTSIRD